MCRHKMASNVGRLSSLSDENGGLKKIRTVFSETLHANAFGNFKMHFEQHHKIRTYIVQIDQRTALDKTERMMSARKKQLAS